LRLTEEWAGLREIKQMRLKDKVAAELNRDGGRAIAMAMDVTSEVQVEAAMGRVVEAFGRIDVLVSNAGIRIVAPLEE
jgi:3-hydroxybutyrate dehydrogenase